MARRKIMITGGRGMVGRNLANHPSLESWTVCAPGREDLDLGDRVATEEFIRREKPDVIVHAAGRVGGIQANIAQPVDFLIDNLDVGINIIMSARAAGVQNLLNLGSSCMYPRNSEYPLREEQVLSGELEPTNEGYAIAKIVSARLCQYIRRENPEFQYKTLIPCNLYGKYDKFSAEFSHLIPAIIVKMHKAKLSGVREVVIWGDGKARREFMYAGDFADAVAQALESTHDLPDLMNIGLGYDHTVKEYYEAVADVVGWKGDFSYDISRPTGMPRKLVDNKRQTEWGWRAPTELRDGIQKTYEYYLQEIT